MKPRELITEVKIPTKIFVKNIEEKILTYEKGVLDSLLSVEPYFQWDNVRLKGDKLLIERSAKPFDKTSRYRGVSGTVESKIIAGNDSTILKTKITLDTAMATFMKYAVGTAIGIIGLSWLILNFNYIALSGVILLEGFIFGVIPLIQRDALDELTEYYNRMISTLSKGHN